MRIGIFGGSFNPPHKMHKKIALNLIENNYLDKVIFVPTGDKYKKNDLISSKQRYKMIELMINGYDNFEVSDYEIKNKLVYTYETLDYFKSKYMDDEIYFVCGMDNLKDIKNWKNYEYLLEEYKVLVIRRNDDNISEFLNEINSKNIIISNIEFCDISSTFIRENINNDDALLEEVIDKNVLCYIRKNNLYK